MKQKSKCFIVGAGEFFIDKLDMTDEDLLIAADGGYDNLMKINCMPDTVIGDFDSVDTIPQHPDIIKLNKIKDDTDMIAAVNLGMERGYRDFQIYGATGDRLDHILANIQTLAYITKTGCIGYIYGRNYAITALTDGTLKFDSYHRGTISVFSNDTTVYGVTLKGLKYTLDNATLTNTYPIGTSNEFIGVESSVTVNDGTLIIIYST